MDPKIGWFQPEQEGPAKDLWTRIFSLSQQVDCININEVNMNGDAKGSEINGDTPRNSVEESPFNDKFYNRTKRKRENLASTFDLNQSKKFLVGKFGGYPWKRVIGRYDYGVVG